MINIKELRIGNLVSTDGKPLNTSIGGTYKVWGIKESFEEIKASVSIPTDAKIIDIIDVWDKYLKPIPLTEYILLRCGFKIDKNDNYILSWSENYCMKFKHIEFEIVDNDVFCSFWIGDGKNKMLLDIQYLHQLQNLYFALTNQELEVKL